MASFLSTRLIEAGTIPYMAPECFEPGGSVDERSDEYALGMILWECVTGERPWKDYNNQIALAIEVSRHGGIDDAWCDAFGAMP